MGEREESIEFRELFSVLRKRMILILSITIIATIASGVVSYYFLTPIYQASTDILVNKSAANQNTINNQEIQADLNLVNTYSVVIKSPLILNGVASKLGMNESQKADLANQITVSVVKNSQVITLTVENPSQSRAVAITNTLATTFTEEIKKIMQIDNVHVLTEAKQNPAAAPVKPKKILIVSIAFAISLIVSMGLAFLLEYLDNTIKTEKDIEKILGLPTLGAITEIPDLNRKKNSRKNRLLHEVAAAREDKACENKMNVEIN